MSMKMNRREFLSRTAAVAVAPMIVPASVLGKGGAVAPSERITVAGIGIQGRGFHDLQWMIRNQDVQFLAICDIQKKQRHKIKAFVDEFYSNTDCAMYSDMREFFEERPDIDAVLIATGDRWHAQASVRAMRAGKDVYTEKPSCMTVAEGRKVVETAATYGRVYQTGTQRLSEPNHVFCIEMALTGRLGKVDKAYAHLAPWDAAKMPRKWKEAQPEPPKEEVDWDAWLGPCPWRPYNAEYVRGGWRGDYDFHTSCIGEWGAHTFAQAQMGIGMGETSPIKYEYVDNVMPPNIASMKDLSTFCLLFFLRTLRPQKVKNMVTLRPIAAAPLAMIKLASTLSRSPEKTMMVFPSPFACATAAGAPPARPFLTSAT